MVSSGQWQGDAISAGSDILGGLIGGLFGDDEPAPVGYNKEYGEEARRLNFGGRVGQRMAMGDPSVAAYFKSRMKTDPESVNQFINDFGGDFLVGEKKQSPAAFGSPAAGGAFTPNAGGGVGFGSLNQGLARFGDESYNENALDQTLSRLSHTVPGTEQQNMGYSGFGNEQPESFGGFSKPKAQQFNFSPSKAAGSGNKYAKLNKERETGSFF